MVLQQPGRIFQVQLSVCGSQNIYLLPAAMAERSGVMTYALKPTSDARPGSVLRPDVPEQAALEDLHRRLVRLAVKLIWNRDDAEDTVQEAFSHALGRPR